MKFQKNLFGLEGTCLSFVFQIIIPVKQDNFAR